MRRERARFAIYAMAGVYLLFMAYNMFQNLEDAGSEKPLMLIFIALFVLVGGGMIGAFIYQMWKQSREVKEALSHPELFAEEEETAEEPEEEAAEAAGEATKETDAAGAEEADTVSAGEKTDAE